MGMPGTEFYELKELEEIKTQANKCTMGQRFTVVLRANKDEYASS